MQIPDIILKLGLPSKDFHKNLQLIRMVCKNRGAKRAIKKHASRISITSMTFQSFPTGFRENSQNDFFLEKEFQS